MGHFRSEPNTDSSEIKNRQYSPFFNYGPMDRLISRATVILLSLFNIMENKLLDSCTYFIKSMHLTLACAIRARRELYVYSISDVKFLGWF
jgi:hypothetical protein